MNEVEFRSWMCGENITKKVQGDLVSRLKKIERTFGNIDLDSEYKKDKCEFLLSLFLNKGENAAMQSYGNVALPIGKYQLSVYRYAIRKYISFLQTISEQQ